MLKFERKIALSAVETAIKSIQSIKLSNDAHVKKDDSPVTIADFTAQTLINHILKSNFPNDSIIAEEDSLELSDELANSILGVVKPLVPAINDKQKVRQLIDLGNSKGGKQGRFWTLDPIDGTKGFIRGGQYAVCLALIIDGKVELGVIGCPRLPFPTYTSTSEVGSIMCAVRGQGAFQKSLTSTTEIPIKTSTNKIVSNSVICESFEAAHSSKSHSSKIAQLLGCNTEKNVQIDSQSKYGIVSRGDADIYLRLPFKGKVYHEKIWDHAAGYLIVEEAGGRVTDIQGKELDFSIGRTLAGNSGVVATSSKEIHAKVLSAVKKVFEEDESKI